MSASDLVENAANAVRELVELRVRFQALDTEVHRMIEAIKEIVKDNDRKQEDLVRRVNNLEAQFAAALAKTMVEMTKETLRPLIDDAVKEMAKAVVRQNPLPPALPDGGSPPGASSGGA